MKLKNETRLFLFYSRFSINSLWINALKKASGRQIKLPTKNVITATNATGRWRTLRTCLLTHRLKNTFLLIRKNGMNGKTKQFKGGGAEIRQL